MQKVSSVARIDVAMAALAMPFGASAATMDVDLSANENFTDGFILSPGGSQQYNFTVLEDLLIQEFSVSGTGPNDPDGDNLENVMFGLGSADTSFEDVEVVESVSGANTFVDGNTYNAGDTFSFFFEDGIENDVSLTLSFDTESPAPVPVPAGGVLLLTAVAGGAALARRRKQRN